MSTARKAILKAYINDVLCDLMVKTTGEQVFLDDTTTVAAKIAEMVTAINARAKSTDVTTQINALKQELLGNLPVEAYNTFTELAAYISEHQEAADALSAAIGNKADKSTVQAMQAVLNGLGTLATKSSVSESDLASSLKEKINTASAGNHSHSNKSLLDAYTQTEANLARAVSNTHTHSNKSALDSITATDIAAWDGKAKVYAAASQPSGLTANDLWLQLTD